MVTDLVRLEIFLPLNHNTFRIFHDLITLLSVSYDGCTYSMPVPPSPFRGIWWNSELQRMAPPEDTARIIVGIDPIERASLVDDLLVISEIIEETGETESWVTISSMARYK